ncbi:MAG: homogentisate 1,2-dioxygenase [Acidimicrobiales bacterium]|nr:MAG: homogentisate 1,2-dioxygenase [Acidimicrobiales bacterium]
MPYYQRVGRVPSKRHVDHRDADGRRLSEELIGRHGFSGESTLLYHRRSPSAVKAIRPAPEVEPVASSVEAPLRPHHLRPAELATPADGADPVLARHVLLRNADVSLAWVAADTDSALTRSVVGDEIVFVQAGSAVLETVVGALAVAPGDYVVVPSGITHRWAEVTDLRALVIATTGVVSVPDRYLSPQGQFLEHAPFCERDLRMPSEPMEREGSDVDVLVRSAGGGTWHTHEHHPFDVVGWDGCVYPWALNVRDFEPIVGSIHQPPPVHQTFAAPGIVVCSFVPRPFDFHPEAIKVPYHHANVDSDEVLFYADGDFMSRRGSGIGRESMSFHPAGFVHGPQPGSVEASADAERTEETAVMVDTFRPLEMTDAARSVSDPDYPSSWG